MMKTEKRANISVKLKTHLVSLVLLLSGFYSTPGVAAELGNIGTTPAIMYDAPTTRGQKLFIAPRGMPVEIIINYGAWTKVRDFSGDLSWIETRQMTGRKNVLVRTLNAKIRTAADESADILFSADKGVLMELVDSSTPGWARVKHNDGATGYIKVSDVWGV